MRSFFWVASPLWDGRRWSLEVVVRGLRQSVGRVVRFHGGQIEAALTAPKYVALEGSY